MKRTKRQYRGREGPVVRAGDNRIAVKVVEDLVRDLVHRGCRSGGGIDRDELLRPPGRDGEELR